jgi:hypothetical protein
VSRAHLPLELAHDRERHSLGGEELSRYPASHRTAWSQKRA